MADDYLLPCTCGRTHRVSARQAGSTLACPCGIDLEVPGMRELRGLETAAPTSAVRQTAWGLRQGLRLIGMLLVGAGVAAGLYFSLVVMPAANETEIPQAQNEMMTPSDAWMVWTFIQRGIVYQVPIDAQKIAYLAYQQRSAERGTNIALTAIVLGGVFSAASFLVRRTRAAV
jgi:hypothetical protein